MDKFEYKVIVNNYISYREQELFLNEKGKESWELVFQTETQETRMQYTFKRKIQ